MEPAEKKKEALSAKFRERFEKFHARALKIDRGRSRAVIHHDFLAGIERERFASQSSLLLRSEQHSRRVPQHSILAPGPVEKLLHVLKRIGTLEPGIEHSVRENKIGSSGAGQRPPDPEAVVLPNPMDDDRVVVGLALPDPT